MTFFIINHSAQPPKFCLLFSNNLRISASKKIHNFWFKKHSLNIEYKNHILHEPQEFICILKELQRDKNFIGGNITMPFKQILINQNDNQFMLSDTVKNTASSNTVYRDRFGNFVLENTDIIGITKSLNCLMKGKNLYKNVIILGGGGSSASCIYSVFLNFQIKKIICLTRNPEKSKTQFQKSKLIKSLLEKNILKLGFADGNILPVSDEILNIIHGPEPLLIINTLPLGSTEMYLDPNILCCSLLHARNEKTTVFFDLVYQKTDACALAKKLNIPHINGQYMLKQQAHKSFFLWTGITA